VEHKHTVSEKTRQVLLHAGWYPGRRIGTEKWEAELVIDGFPPLHEAARQFLHEYGGLAFRLSGPGITCAREPFNLVPMACAGEADRFIAWSDYLNREIAPIGDHAAGTNGRGFLGIDDRGEILRVVDRVATYGRMPYGMDGLVLGYMPREIE
jgi:hypothetical protein